MSTFAFLLCMVGIKYRSIGRIFFYFEMLNFILSVSIPKIPAIPWNGSFQISLSLLVSIGFSVDVKSNLIALIITLIILDIFRTSLEHWEVNTGYVIEQVIVTFLSGLALVMYVTMMGHMTQLSKRLRIQMNEYFNLLNRMHEGIIVLRRSLKHGDASQNASINKDGDESEANISGASQDYESQIMFETVAAR